MVADLAKISRKFDSSFVLTSGESTFKLDLK